MSDTHTPTRRDFVRAAGTAAVGASLSPFVTGLAGDAFAQPGKRRYAIVGTGDRGSSMWGRDLVRRYPDLLEFVGLCDLNPKRAIVARDFIGVPSCPTFTSFDEMVEKTKPDLLMVTTVDGFHHEYIIKGLDRGLEVMTEKPLTTDETKCQAILDAEKRNTQPLVITFNLRYAPDCQHVKEILLAGEIGRIISVDFNWYLDVIHGADYFRRWHRLRKNSGSLLVHKATHHFDLMNWWLAADPIEVSGYGGLDVYGRNGSFRAQPPADNCRNCPHTAKCRFYYDMTKSKRYMDLYAKCEDVDGYFRDGCVFREDIDIFDNMQAIVKYSNGATMSYSLNAYMPYEGYRVAFNGEKGRVDVQSFERQPWEQPDNYEVYITKSFGKRTKVPMPRMLEGHGGGDDRMRDLIFRKVDMPDYMKLPDSRAGAMSCLIGIAIRNSIDQRKPIKIADLVRL
jgi:predicted dehydrogenase